MNSVLERYNPPPYCGSPRCQDPHFVAARERVNCSAACRARGAKPRRRTAIVRCAATLTERPAAPVAFCPFSSLAQAYSHLPNLGALRQTKACMKTASSTLIVVWVLATSVRSEENLGGSIRAGVSATGELVAEGISPGRGEDSSSKSSEPQNPFLATGDQTDECYSWAADGQCTANPAYMLSSCKYSCWEWFEHRRKKFPTAPIDKRFDCHSWAQRGECHKNTAFMRDECPESCKDKYEAPEAFDEPPVKKKKKSKSKKAKNKAKKASE